VIIFQQNISVSTDKIWKHYFLSSENSSGQFTSSLYLFQFIVEEQSNITVRLDPILKTIRKSHYQYVTELRVWDITLKHSTVADIVSNNEF